MHDNKQVAALLALADMVPTNEAAKVLSGESTISPPSRLLHAGGIGERW